MKTIIFINTITPISIDIRMVAALNDRYILIANKQTLSHIHSRLIAQFDTIHILESVDLKSTIPIIDRYFKLLNIYNSLYILSHDELSLSLNAELNEHYNLNGIRPEQIKFFRKKTLMKEALENSGLIIPKFFAFDKKEFKKNRAAYLDNKIYQLKFPLIAKPVEGVSCRDVIKLFNKEALYVWAKEAVKRDENYEIEEFYYGKAYNCDMVVKENKILFFSPCEYLHPLLKFIEGKPMGLIRLSEEDDRWPKLYQFGKTLINCLKPPNGMVHFEVIEMDSGELVFIEVAARPSGSIVSTIEEKNNGFSYEMIHFKIRLGLPFSLKRTEPKSYYSWAIYPNKKGKIVEIKMPNIESQCEWGWFVKVGDVKEAAQHIADPSYFAAKLIYHHPDYQQLYQDFLTLRHFDPIVVKKLLNK